MSKVSLLQIFAVFAKVGAFTIGGGYMMIPAIQEEMHKRKWIRDEELPDIVALAQSAPGLLAANMAIFAGYKVRGLPGSIAATLGCITPPFIIILLIAMFFNNFKDIPLVESIFKGVRPAAVAIIAAYTIKMSAHNRHWWEWTLTLATMILVSVLKFSAVYILLIVIISAIAISFLRQSHE